MLNHILEAYYKFPKEKYIFSQNTFFTYEEIVNSAINLNAAFNISEINKPIAIILPRNHLSIISFIATWISGNFYVPLDPELPSERINSIIEELNSPLIIIDSSSPSNFDFNKKNLTTILDISLLSLNIKNDIRDLNNLIKNKSKPNDPAYCIYTSGSTGKPKGVLISHSSLLSYIQWFVYEFKLNSKTRFGNMAQLYFDISAVDIYTPFISRGTTYFIPEKVIKFPIDTIKFINKNGINSVMWVPSALTNIAKSNALESLAPKKLTNIFFAGEQFSINIFEYWRKYVPNANYVNMYGPTEATITCTHFVIPRDEKLDRIPIGYPSNNSEILLIDNMSDDGMRPNLIKKSNVIGEIFISGECLSLGYWKNLELTNLKFINNPFITECKSKLYRTGDLGKYDESGRLIFIGRNDSQIKYRGYRIELGDIEAAVESIDSVLNCCAYFFDSNALLGIAIESNNKLLDKKYILLALKKKIPNYMIPKLIVIKEKFPLTETGKIDKRKLKESFTKLDE